VAKPIKVALVNDYMILLEGLLSLLRSSDPEFEVTEIDIRKGPKGWVDVTLLDTYGELESVGEECALLAPTLKTERSWCSAFPTDLRQCVRPCVPVHKGLYPRLYPGNRSLMALRLPQTANVSF